MVSSSFWSPFYDLHKRWHSFDIRTPLGRTTIISAYMKPDPTSTAALTEWDELIDFVASRHLKKRRVILLGDLKISHNTLDSLQTQTHMHTT